MAEKIGRNDPCPCGSNKKYKRCHGDPSNNSPKAGGGGQRTVTARTLSERNMLLLYAISDVFGLKRGFKWKDIKRAISAEQVSRFYRIIAELYPPQLNTLSLIPNDDKTRALYLGETDPTLTSHGAYRMGLYTDEILVVMPFYNPLCKIDALNPIKNPNPFRVDTFKLLQFLFLLAPALDAGLVTFIPPPLLYDGKTQLQNLAIANAYGQGRNVTAENVAGITKDYAQALNNIIRAESTDARKELLAQLHSHLTESELAVLLPYFDLLGEQTPSVLNSESLENSLNEIAAQILSVKGGLDTETALHICYQVNAFPYTSTDWRWQQLSQTAQESETITNPWKALSQSVQEHDFSFLNNVDRHFTGEFRSMGRAAGFRDYLRKIWHTVDSRLTLDHDLDSQVTELQSGFAAEFSKLEEDWALTRKDLTRWMTYISEIDASAAEPIVTGKLEVAIPSGGFQSTVTRERLMASNPQIRSKVALAAYINTANK